MYSLFCLRFLFRLVLRLKCVISVSVPALLTLVGALHHSHAALAAKGADWYLLGIHRADGRPILFIPHHHQQVLHVKLLPKVPEALLLKGEARGQADEAEEQREHGDGLHG